MYHPLRSLREGNWFKLICGASFQHLPAIRNLTLAYALAGADCIDVAADPAVIGAAKEALRATHKLAQVGKGRAFGFKGKPWLMVSLNAGEDPHFRKAEFDPLICPADCPRPCETICPAQAIVFKREDGFSGVVDARCYGCGRCLPICPIQQISTRSHVSTPAAIAPLVLEGVDAVEIHTQVGQLRDFERLWQAIAPWIHQLKLVAISCPDGEGLIDYLWSLHHIISPLSCPLIWQTDGRPMSGDIGDGTTRAAVKLGQKVLLAGLPGYVQLAGGTNNHTVAKLQAGGLLQTNPSCLPLFIGKQDAVPTTHQNRFVSGVAYGSYARVLLSPILEQLEQLSHSNTWSVPQPLSLSANQQSPKYTHETVPLNAGQDFPLIHLEEVPHLLWQAVNLAHSLVSQLKFPARLSHSPTNHDFYNQP